MTLKEYLDRLMFLLGKDLMEGKFISKEIGELFPNVEDLMSCFNINYLLNSIPQLRDLYESIEIIKDEKSMYHAVMTIIFMTTSKSRSPLRKKDKEDEEPYESLAHFAGRRERTTFITFNYDTLLDSQLLVSGVPFTYQLATQNEDDTANANCRLLKLHGSSNIWHCRNCQRNSLYKVESLEEYCDLFEEMNLGWNIPDTQCCGNPTLFPLIVPPTMLKTMNTLPLMKLWIAAEAAVERSQTIAFIGYSFPKEDIMARSLIRSTLLRAEELKYIIYINRNPAPLSFIERVLSERQSKPEILSFTDEEGLAEERVPILFKT
ncbi:MAG: hypothetical protein WBA22_11135 [Candidatus Methanofastidiosia archaeon]